jgi:UDP-3-O-[3-hydroxymyristoyl] N-acetylglucosamine deacetylase / 3-hydroxyacyl-[acyl-carrier-protein] dehydratase
MPSETYQVTAMVDFGTKVLGTQNATLKVFQILKKKLPMLVLLVFFMNWKIY